MRKLFSLFLTLFISSISIGFAQPASDSSPANNQFAADLYSTLSSQQGNLFFSPYSLSSALEMVYEGARGRTAQEMSSVLHLDPDDVTRRAQDSLFIQQINQPDKTYELSVANALWAQKAFPFKDDYFTLINKTYFAEVRNLDFVADSEASRVTINTWVSDKTKNRIKDLLPVGSIKSITHLVVTDAVYFKGKWKVPFIKTFTKLDDFWLTPDQSIKTDMMTLEGKSFEYMEDDQVQVVKLPYQGDDLSMIIILPRSKDIQDLGKAFNLQALNQWQKPSFFKGVNIFLPKFKFEWRDEMSHLLMEMGINLAFDPKNADFSGMANLQPMENLYIDKVFHKAWIETNEEGTEAAAATAVVITARECAFLGAPQKPKIFRADHPFILLIQDNKNRHILLMGRVSDPRKK